MIDPQTTLNRLTFLLAASRHDEYHGHDDDDDCQMCTAMDEDVVNFRDVHLISEVMEDCLDDLLDHLNGGGKLPEKWAKPRYSGATTC